MSFDDLCVELRGNKSTDRFINKRFTHLLQLLELFLDSEPKNVFETLDSFDSLFNKHMIYVFDEFYENHKDKFLQILDKIVEKKQSLCKNVIYSNIDGNNKDDFQLLLEFTEKNNVFFRQGYHAILNILKIYKDVTPDTIAKKKWINEMNDTIDIVISETALYESWYGNLACHNNLYSKCISVIKRKGYWISPKVLTNTLDISQIVKMSDDPSKEDLMKFIEILAKKKYIGDYDIIKGIELKNKTDKYIMTFLIEILERYSKNVSDDFINDSQEWNPFKENIFLVKNIMNFNHIPFEIRIATYFDIIEKVDKHFGEELLKTHMRQYAKRFYTYLLKNKCEKITLDQFINFIVREDEQKITQKSWINIFYSKKLKGDDFLPLVNALSDDDMQHLVNNLGIHARIFNYPPLFHHKLLKAVGKSRNMYYVVHITLGTEETPDRPQMEDKIQVLEEWFTENPIEMIVQLTKHIHMIQDVKEIYHYFVEKYLLTYKQDNKKRRIDERYTYDNNAKDQISQIWNDTILKYIGSEYFNIAALEKIITDETCFNIRDLLKIEVYNILLIINHKSLSNEIKIIAIDRLFTNGKISELLHILNSSSDEIIVKYIILFSEANKYESDSFTYNKYQALKNLRSFFKDMKITPGFIHIAEKIFEIVNNQIVINNYFTGSIKIIKQQDKNTCLLQYREEFIILADTEGYIIWRVSYSECLRKIVVAGNKIYAFMIRNNRFVVLDHDTGEILREITTFGSFDINAIKTCKYNHKENEWMFATCDGIYIMKENEEEKFIEIKYIKVDIPPTRTVRIYRNYLISTYGFAYKLDFIFNIEKQEYMVNSKKGLQHYRITNKHITFIDEQEMLNIFRPNGDHIKYPLDSYYYIAIVNDLILLSANFGSAYVPKCILYKIENNMLVEINEIDTCGKTALLAKVYNNNIYLDRDNKLLLIKENEIIEVPKPVSAKVLHTYSHSGILNDMHVFILRRY